METDRGEWKIREAVSRNALTTGLVICAAVIMLAAPCFGVRLACAGVFAAGIVRQKKREALRVQELTVYLERAGALRAGGGRAFQIGRSDLQDGDVSVSDEGGGGAGKK